MVRLWQQRRYNENMAFLLDYMARSQNNKKKHNIRPENVEKNGCRFVAVFFSLNFHKLCMTTIARWRNFVQHCRAPRRPLISQRPLLLLFFPVILAVHFNFPNRILTWLYRLFGERESHFRSPQLFIRLHSLSLSFISHEYEMKSRNGTAQCIAQDAGANELTGREREKRWSKSALETLLQPHHIRPRCVYHNLYRR